MTRSSKRSSGTTDYSDSVVRSCFNNIRAITHLARKQNFFAEDPGEDVTMPITKISEKPVMPIDSMPRLLGAIEELGDLCLMLVTTFGRGKRTGQAVPRHAKNFLRWRIRPIADRLDTSAACGAVSGSEAI